MSHECVVHRMEETCEPRAGALRIQLSIHSESWIGCGETMRARHWVAGRGLGRRGTRKPNSSNTHGNIKFETIALYACKKKASAAATQCHVLAYKKEGRPQTS